MLEIKNLSLKIDDQEFLFRNLNLVTKPYEITLLVGKSGCGKTALLKTIAGLYKKDDGSIFINGKETLNEISHEIGMLFEKNALFDNMTALENVAFPFIEVLKLSTQESIFKAKKLMNSLNLEEAYHKRISELSGGMAKRVAIARALALNPIVLLLDEPTMGLDPINAKVVVNLIKNIKTNYKTTILLSSNNLEYSLNLADKIALINDKSLILYNSKNDFIKSNFSDYGIFLK